VDAGAFGAAEFDWDLFAMLRLLGWLQLIFRVAQNPGPHVVVMVLCAMMRRIAVVGGGDDFGWGV